MPHKLKVDFVINIKKLNNSSFCFPFPSLHASNRKARQIKWISVFQGCPYHGKIVQYLYEVRFGHLFVRFRHIPPLSYPPVHEKAHGTQQYGIEAKLYKARVCAVKIKIDFFLHFQTCNLLQLSVFIISVALNQSAAAQRASCRGTGRLET